MFLVGLTGGIATGKTLVSTLIQELGIVVIDADLIAKQIVEPGEPAHQKIKDAFGPEVFQENGQLDRPKLGALIFSDIDKRRKLNSITHPYIYGKIRKLVFHYFLKGEQFVVLDLPLLYESGKVLSYLYKTIVVSCNDDLQIERLMSRNNYSRADAIARIEAQMPLSEKTERADFIIENSDSIHNTRKQVDSIISLLKSSRRHIRNKVLYGIIFIVACLSLVVGIISLMGFFFF